MQSKPETDIIIAIFAAIQEHQKSNKVTSNVSNRQKVSNWRKKHIATFTDRQTKATKIVP
jgi:hypothetical protein